MEKFIKFLEDNSAWENFERAFTESERDVRDYKETCKVLKNSEISYAFTWSKTAEGHDYWEELHKKWRRENRSLREKLLSDD